MSKILVITGMHRSGTSLIASLLQRAGVNVGERLVAPARANPRGFFEDADFYEFHEQALRGRERTILVTEPFAFDPTPAELERARTLIRQREHHPVWGWKDPRTSLFLEFWHQLLPHACFLFLYRHPLDVLLSLLRRREFYGAGLSEGLDAWCIYNASIKDFCTRHRQSVLLCHAYGLLEQIDHFRTLLQRQFALDLPIDASIRDALYHPGELRRRALSPEVDQLLRSIHPASVELYEQLNAVADLPFTPAPESGQRSPELLALSQCVLAMPGPLATRLRRGFLLSLVSLIDFDVTEDFYRQHNRDIQELEQGKAWLEEQWGNWRRIADERERVIQEQQAWIKELEQGKAWLEEQWGNWRRIADERERVIQEQQGWIQELERGKAWLEEQRDSWRRVAEERERVNAQSAE